MATPSLPVVELERHLRWRVWPTVLFIFNLSALLVLAIVSRVIPPWHPRGLPADPASIAAAAALAGRTPVLSGQLRFRADALGGETTHAPVDAAIAARIAAARRAFGPAHRAHRGDPRTDTALAALDMAEHAWSHAQGRYRAAIERAPHYGEARLGLGVALALEADGTNALWQARALRLQAIAQFASVDAVDPEYPLALYDRVLTLLDVGRAAEARDLAASYARIEPDAAWRARLAAAVAATR